MKLNILAILISVASFVFSIYLWSESRREFVFVDLKFLFDNFEYKKHLEKDFERVLQYRRMEIDSLEQDYQQSSATPDEETLRSKQVYLAGKKRAYQEDNIALSQEFDKKIYLQLKQYVREYAQAKHIRLVIGELEDNLNIVGPGEHDNINKELVDFVNKKYQNKPVE